MISGILLLMALLAAGCGGDDGHPPHPPPPPGAVTIRGNVAARTALLDSESAHSTQLAVGRVRRLGSRADAEDVGIEVCIEGTPICSATDAKGTFALVTPAGGAIVLTFTAVDYTGRMMLADVPIGAVIIVHDVECSTSTGECTPRQMEVEAP